MKKIKKIARKSFLAAFCIIRRVEQHTKSCLC